MTLSTQIEASFLAHALGDALGLPVQFESRDMRKIKPIESMTGYGEYNMPPGTWSDDTSLLLCTAESLARGYNLEDMGQTFVRWMTQGHLTPDGYAFDVGMSTRRSIQRIITGVHPLHSGDNEERQNGNGALMRILPLIFWSPEMDTEHIQMVRDVSGITHAHPISQAACLLFVRFGQLICDRLSIDAAYLRLCKEGYTLLFNAGIPHASFPAFNRILDGNIANIPHAQIYSSGYVVHTLEAALWCLLNTASTCDCLLSAVALGEDTDTTAAVAGGLAGIAWGTSSVPEQWKQTLRCKEMVSTQTRNYISAISSFR